MIQAIQTAYKGYRFRSRLEARYAVMFDTLGLKWEYEKEGFNLDGTYYLPDFWLPEIKAWVEIKGQEPTDDEIALCKLLCELSKDNVVLFNGPPDVSSYEDYWNSLVSFPNAVEFIFFEIDQYQIDHFLTDPDEFGGIEKVERMKKNGGAVGKSAPIDFGYHYELIKKAVQAARSARFEHGETPR